MARKIKRERALKSQPLKTNLAFFQYWSSTFPTWISWAREVHLMQTQFCWIPESKTYQHTQFQQKKSSYERDMRFLRWQMKPASRQVLWRNMSILLPKVSKPTSKSLFRQFSSSKSKVKAWRFYARLFLLFKENSYWNT
jgi:hypothetical protein